uniref:Mitochondrial glycine transporter n=1 Tax=Panagrellus redivivus TaxID=6233 RepID=A0A7E4VJI5_PANRE
MADVDEQRKDNSSVQRSIAFGTVSGLTTSVLLQPLDRLKTLAQQQNKTNGHVTVDVLIRRVWQEHGLLGYWKGLTPTLWRVVPGVSVYFGLIEASRVFVIEPQHAWEHFIVGTGARSCAAVILHPTTLIKTRLESSLYRHTSTADAFRTVVREQGVRGLWCGLMPTLFRDAPFSGFYLMFYRQQLAVVEQWSSHDLTPSLRVLCGISAGLLACVLTQPFDVLKTTVQLYPRDYSSMRTATARIYTELGLKSFFKGFVLRALRRSLASALNWTLFDELFKRT